MNRTRNDLNVSRRLRRMLKASGLPRVGPAHILRMRYAQVTHILCLMQRHCTHGRIVLAFRELLDGWADTEEEDDRAGGYQDRLLNAINVTQASIEQLMDGDWYVDVPACHL
jgi:hypothetical protein